MKSDPDSESFDSLLRLLALKRHEQPPPGYFENFSRAVIVRLKSGEVRKRGWWHDIVDEAPWLQPILAAFEARPLLAGVFGVVICALVLSGITYSQKLDQVSATVSSELSPTPGDKLFSSATFGDGSATLTSSEPAPEMLTAASSTNAVLDPKIPEAVLKMFRPEMFPFDRRSVPASFSP